MSDGAKHMVVGIDGSPGSAHAIEWAVAHAPQLGVIRPVTAWHEPWWSSRPPAPGMPRLPEELRHEKQVREHVGEQLAGIEPAMLDEPVVARGRAGPLPGERGPRRQPARGRNPRPRPLGRHGARIGQPPLREPCHQPGRRRAGRRAQQ